MISLRGGIDTLGLPAIAMKVMLWFDVFMAAESGTRPFFTELPERLKRSGVQPLSAEEAVRVADGVSPLRHNIQSDMEKYELDDVRITEVIEDDS
jgi:hypothetical protein